MKNIYTVIVLLISFTFFGLAVNAQTFCGEVIEESAAPGKFRIKVFLASAGAAAYEAGSSNLVLEFNDLGLGAPTLISSPVANPPFVTVGLTTPAIDKISVNMEYGFDGTCGFGATINTTITEIAEIEFDILDPAHSAAIVWDSNG